MGDVTTPAPLGSVIDSIEGRYYLVRDPDVGTVLHWSIYDAGSERVGSISREHAGCVEPGAHDYRWTRFAGDGAETGEQKTLEACAVAITGQRRLTLVWLI